MSYENPNSEIRLFNVPWTKGDNNLLMFSSVSAQTSAMNSFFDGLSSSKKYSGNNFDIIVDGVITIPKNSYAVNKFNYIMFRNPEISTSTRTWWYAYIDRVEWASYNSCNVYFTLDAWQNYQFDITFKKCFIERSHVPVSTSGDWAGDVAGNYLAPEPVSVAPQFERTIEDFSSLSWNPTWVLHSTSKSTINQQGETEYEYSGSGSGSTLTAEYGRFVSSPTDIQDIVKNYGRKSMDEILDDISYSGTNWKALLNAVLSGGASPDTSQVFGLSSATTIADLQDHRNELIGLYAIPAWVKGNSSGWASNDIVHEQLSVTLDSGTLACTNNGNSYTPRNKKMLTSLCKGYSIYTPNGFKTTFKPELFTTNNITVGLYGCQMATDGIMLHVGNYKNPSATWHRLNYSCQGRLGYDANTGLDKTLNQLSTAIGAIGTAAGITGSVAGGNAMGAVSGVEGAISGATNMIDAMGQRGINTGSSGNIMSITGGRATPKFVDISPNWAECEYIDDYLDVYGYSIQEVKSINITSRPAWNYIKVAKLNATINAPDEYAQVIMNAFQNGCHIWHTSISNVGNFGLTNR